MTGAVTRLTGDAVARVARLTSDAVERLTGAAAAIIERLAGGARPMTDGVGVPLTDVVADIGSAGMKTEMGLGLAPG